MSVARKYNFKKHLPLILILLLAVFLRFFNYSDRIIVSLDQGRDALIGIYSVENGKAPLIGPPSSSWGFNFGPLYYYFIVIFELFIPHLLAPWIGFTLLSIVSVFLVYKIGEHTDDKAFGIVAALLTAVSFAEIENSANLLNTALVSFAVFLSFFSLSQVLNKKNMILSLLVGFGSGLAINSHLQSLPIASLVLITPILFPGKPMEKLKVFIFASLGFLISFIPILIFESQHYFAWIKSLIDYTLHGQQKFYTPVRWLTEVTQFWPGQFGRVLFGKPELGVLLLAVTVIAGLLAIIKKIKIPRIIIAAGIVLVLEVLSVRYYKGPRSPEYFVFLHFFIIFFFAWALSTLIKLNKVVGLSVSVVLISFMILQSVSLLSRPSHSSATLEIFRNIELNQTEPVSLYALPRSHENAYTLYYFLLKTSLASLDGVPLAICDNHDSVENGREFCPQQHRLFQSGRFILYNYSAFNKTDRTVYPATQIDPEILYKRTYNNYELIKY